MPLVLTRVPLHASAFPPCPKTHSCLVRKVPLSCLHFSHAWLCLKDAWRRRNAKGREHFSKLAVRTFPQKVGCTVQLSWVLLGPLPPDLCATWLWIKRCVAGGEAKSRLGIEMRTLYWVAFIPKGRWITLALISRRWHRQTELQAALPALPGPRQAGTAAPAGNSLANPGSQPSKPTSKPVLSLLGSRLWTHEWPAWGDQQS